LTPPAFGVGVVAGAGVAPGRPGLGDPCPAWVLAWSEPAEASPKVWGATL